MPELPPLPPKLATKAKTDIDATLQLLRKEREAEESKNNTPVPTKEAVSTTQIREKEQSLYNKIYSLENQLEFLINEEADLIKNTHAIRKDLRLLKSQQQLSEAALNEYYNPAEDSLTLKQEIIEVKEKIKKMVQEKTAILYNESTILNSLPKENKKIIDAITQTALNAYNSETENVLIKLEKTRTPETAFNKIEKAKTNTKKILDFIDGRINQNYHNLRKKEIELAFKQKNVIAREREETREAKAAAREEEKAREEAKKQAEIIALQEAELKRRIEEARERVEARRIELLEREEQHYDKVIEQLDQDSPELEELLQEQERIQEAKTKNSDIIANTKAGYVYVISNVGAFGEGIVKIGLTRRSNPDDRVKELGDASVPFLFDKHLMHFSKDAVALEKMLHKKFMDKSVNKVNIRKEFFHATPKEVKQALQELEEIGKIPKGAITEYNEEPSAEEYYQSIDLNKKATNDGDNTNE